jgi:hypothetical protein
MSLIDQLWEIYDTSEWWHDRRQPKEEIDAYHEEKFRLGEIITISDGNTLVGYVTFTINHGCCYIEDLFIHPEYRRGRAFWQMKKRLFEKFPGKVFFGERNKFNRRYTEFKIRS